MSLLGFLTGALRDSKSTVSANLRQKVNAELSSAGMDGNGRFRSASYALSAISRVLDNNDIEWGQVLDSFQFGREKGTAFIYLASQTKDPFSPVDIENLGLHFSWETLREEKVEVIAYLT